MKWLDVLLQLGEGAAWNVVQQLDRWRWQLLQSLLMIVLAAVCGLVVLVLAACLALLAYWESHRFEILWLLMIAYAGLGLWLARRSASWGRRPLPIPARCAACTSCRNSHISPGGCRASP
jgi:hypothetical protein